MNPKIVWGIVGVVALLGLALLASRVGNIGARSARSGDTVPELTLSDPTLPGVAVAVHWTTALGEEVGPVTIKARSSGDEVVIGQGEFGVGQAMVTIPCTFGGENLGIGLYVTGEDGEDQLLTQQSVKVLPAGPDCLR